MQIGSGLACSVYSITVTLKRPSFLSTQNKWQIIYSPCTCSLECPSKKLHQPAIHSPRTCQSISGSTPLLDLSTSQFHSKLKTHLFHNHFLLSLFHALTSLNFLALLTWLPDFHLTFIFVVSSTTNSFTCITAYSCSQCPGISLHQCTLVGFCRHFKSPHSFHRVISFS